ncbi:MAG: thiamine phosphate synthase [Bacteroidales bacterium]|jgi:thiamine-phosphate pyrophosphorylase|nr:thiamine phosphate synthase [Bacteroidales bacterium]
MWRIIGISAEDIVCNEHKKIEQYLERGIDFFHIRKPNFSLKEMKDYIEKFSPNIRKRLTIHYYIELCLEYSLGGVHFNEKNISLNDFRFNGVRKSYSAHKEQEVEKYYKEMDYIFLSPIYDSISKQGYKSKFSFEKLRKMELENKKVIALGGVKKDKFEELKALGFSGCALKGELWNKE